MKKTPKRRLLSRTAIYTTMTLVLSSQYAAADEIVDYRYIVSNTGVVTGRRLPGQPGVREGRKHISTPGSKFGPKNLCKELNVPWDPRVGCPILTALVYDFKYDNNDTLTAGFPTATTFNFGGGSAPLWGKVSGLNSNNHSVQGADQWLTTYKPEMRGKTGYDFTDTSCWASGVTGGSRQCPVLPFKFFFEKNSATIEATGQVRADGVPIYKLKAHPWLGISFEIAAPSYDGNGNITAGSGKWERPSVDGAKSKIAELPIRINANDQQYGKAFQLRAKLHKLSDPGGDSLAAQEIKLGEITTSKIALTSEGDTGNKGRTMTVWRIEDTGHIDVKLELPKISTGGCTRAQYTAAGPDDSQYAIVAPAPLGAGFPGKAAAVVTDPKSASSRILFYTLNKDKKGENLGTDYLESKSFTEPVFTGRKTAIRLANGVSLSDSDNIAGISNGIFGINSTQNDEWKTVLLRWTDRRDTNDNPFETFNKAIDAKTHGKLYGQQYRIRDNNKRDLGDIVNSPVTAVGNYLATAANDGMVHIFKRNDDGSYNLKLSYIPGTMPRKDLNNAESTLAKDLHNFANENYTGGLYGVDGGFVLRKIKDRVFMFGAMGQGGKGAYALDLTKAESGSPIGVSLFDITGNGLGYTVGTPQIGKTQNGKYAAFLASGYAAKDINSPENQTALYVYDLESSGTQIAKITVPNGKGGLSSPTLVDKDLDGTVDIAYAGDRGGNMYRFDLSNWSVRTIFRGTKPITSAPAVSQLEDKRVVIFGTGSDLTEEDVASQDIQSVYGIFDDKKGKKDSLVVAQDVMENELLKQELTQVPTKDGKILFLNNNKISNEHKGWAVDLLPGQRVTIKPTVVLRTVFVTIHNYNANGCGAETAFLGIDTANGGELTKESARPVVPDDRIAKKVGEKKDAEGNNIPVGCMKKDDISLNLKNEDNKIICPNGYVYPKLLTASYLDSQKTSDHPRTADGDAGGSGDDTDKLQKGNRCFFSKGVHTLLMNDMSDLDVVGPICKMKRISWREIFL